MGRGVEKECGSGQINTSSREASQGWAQNIWTGTHLPSAAGSGAGSCVNWNFRLWRMLVAKLFFLIYFFHS